MIRSDRPDRPAPPDELDIPEPLRESLRARARATIGEEHDEARAQAREVDHLRRLRPHAERVMAFVRALAASGRVRGRVPLVRWERGHSLTVWSLDHRGVLHLRHHYKAWGGASEHADVESLLEHANDRRLREVARHIERGTIWQEMERALEAEAG